MKLRHLYLVLCLVGLLLPYWQFLPWLFEHGFNPSLFVGELFANRIAAFFGIDVILSAVVLLIFVSAEGRRLGLRLLWLPIVAAVTVGVCLGLPLFLYQRQAHLDQAGA